MNITFVTDPMPTRTGPKNAMEVYNIFQRLCNTFNVSGCAAANLIGTDELADSSVGVRQGVKGSELGFNQTWPNNCIDEWISLVNSVQPKQYENCKRFFLESGTNIVFLCDKHDTIRSAALACQIPVIHLAQGPLRSPLGIYWLIDPNGIGPESLCSASFLDTEQCNERKVSAANYVLDTIHAGQPQTKENATILIALQPSDDLASLVWNKGYDVGEFVDLVSSIARDFQNYRFVLRQHPCDGTDLSSILLNLPGNVTIDLEKQPFWNVVCCYDAVISFSSAIAAEAALLDIPTLSLGKHIFSEGTSPDLFKATLISFMKNIKERPEKKGQGFFQRFTRSAPSFFVDQIFIELPSFFLSIANGVCGTKKSPQQWFRSRGGLPTVVDQLYNEALRNRVYTLQAENYKRITQHQQCLIEINELREKISILMDQNHLRILEEKRLSGIVEDMLRRSPVDFG